MANDNIIRNVIQGKAVAVHMLRHSIRLFVVAAVSYTHLDVYKRQAEGYEQGGSELVMGQAIAELGWSRDSYIVSSKVFWGGAKPTQRGLSSKHVTEACHAALKRCLLYTSRCV